MAQYYGIVRTDDYLAHYGVKGMRWGVRKAKESGNEKRLAKHYAKAQKKLAKLNKKADPNYQKSNEAKYEKRAKNYKIIGRAGLGVASVGLGGNQLAQALRNNIWKKYYSNRDAVWAEDKIRRADLFNNSGNHYVDAKTGMPAWATPKDYANHVMSESKKIDNRLKSDMSLVEKNRDKSLSRNKTAQDIGEKLFYAGAGAALAGYSGYGINKLKAHNARKRQTVEGHKKAVSERDAWQREMNKAFAGTKYANGGSRHGVNNKPAKVAGVRVGKHFVGISNRPATPETRERVKQAVLDEYNRTHKKRK